MNLPYVIYDIVQDKRFISAVLLVLIFGLAAAGHAHADEKPPLSPVRIAGEIVCGYSAGLAGGVVSVLALKPIADSVSGGRDVILAIGVSTGYAFGSVGGVYLVGSLGNQTGSFSTTMLGVLMGAAVGVTGAIITVAIIGDEDNHYAELPLFVAPAIGATIGFNLSRRYKSPSAESGTALINVGDGQIGFAVPVIYLLPNAVGGKGLNQNIDLLRVRF